MGESSLIFHRLQTIVCNSLRFMRRQKIPPWETKFSAKDCNNFCEKMSRPSNLVICFDHKITASNLDRFGTTVLGNSYAENRNPYYRMYKHTRQGNEPKPMQCLTGLKPEAKTFRSKCMYLNVSFSASSSLEIDLSRYLLAVYSLDPRQCASSQSSDFKRKYPYKNQMSRTKMCLYLTEYIPDQGILKSLAGFK